MNENLLILHSILKFHEHRDEMFCIFYSGKPKPSQHPSMLRNINCQRINLKLSSPQRSIVASLGNGRLGNQLSNFASCYAISKEYVMYHYLNSMQLEILQNVFDLPKWNNVENGSYYLWDTGM